MDGSSRGIACKKWGVKTVLLRSKVDGRDRAGAHHHECGKGIQDFHPMTQWVDSKATIVELCSFKGGWNDERTQMQVHAGESLADIEDRDPTSVATHRLPTWKARCINAETRCKLESLRGPRHIRAFFLRLMSCFSAKYAIKA
eukprot:scaffold287_cov337-Pavlova_lutheri.AAC.83